MQLGREKERKKERKLRSKVSEEKARADIEKRAKHQRQKRGGPRLAILHTTHTYGRRNGAVPSTAHGLPRPRKAGLDKKDATALLCFALLTRVRRQSLALYPFWFPFSLTRIQ